MTRRARGVVIKSATGFQEGRDAADFGRVSFDVPPTPPIGCTIAMQTYEGLDPSLLPADIGPGQIVSITNKTLTLNQPWIAGGPLPGVPIDWPAGRVRIVGSTTADTWTYDPFVGTTYTETGSFAVSNQDNSAVITYRWIDIDGGGLGLLFLATELTGPGGTLQVAAYPTAAGGVLTPLAVPGGLTNRIAAGIDGNGLPYLFINGNPEPLSFVDAVLGPIAPTPIFTPGGADLLTPLFQFSLSTGSTGSTTLPGVTASAEILTDKSKFPDTFPAATDDWCGNDLNA